MNGEASEEVKAVYRREREERHQRTMPLYGPLYDVIIDIIGRHDPIGIIRWDGCEHNPRGNEEYQPEVSTIFPRIMHADSEEVVRRIIHEEFVRWIDPRTVGPESHYDGIAREVWSALHGSSRK